LKESFEKAQQAVDIQTSFKDWVGVTLATNIVLVIISILLLLFVLHPFTITLVSIMLALSVFFILVTIHEVIHGLVAESYGYKYEFGSRSLFTVPGIRRPFSSIFIEVTHENNAKWKKDKLRIAIAPHLIMLPLGSFLFLIGYQWGILFLLYLGLFTLVGHLIALGIDVMAK